MTKINRGVVIIVLLCGIILPITAQAKKVQAAESSTVPLVEAFIKYRQTGWQNYEFFIAANLPPNELKFQWTIDEKESYETENIKIFFHKGEHVVRVRVEDKYGNVVYDNVKLDIRFWSLHNNWFWWLIYLIVICIIVYYWFVKLFYLLNRKKMSKQVREFVDMLDQHGWLERIVAGVNTSSTPGQRGRKTKNKS